MLQSSGCTSVRKRYCVRMLSQAIYMTHFSIFSVKLYAVFLSLFLKKDQELAE